MRKVLFNDPFSPDCIERLKFLYLYYDEVHAIDYSWLTELLSMSEFEKSLDEALHEETEKWLSKLTVPGTGDKNIRARVQFAAQQKMSGVKKRIREHIKSFLEQHYKYWAYLKHLADSGFLVLDTESIPKSGLVTIHPRTNQPNAKETAKLLASEVTQWCVRFLISLAVAKRLTQEESLLMAPLVGPLFAVYILGGMVKQDQGFEVYTGENEQLRAMRALQETVPAHTKLAEAVVAVELPTVRYLDIEQLTGARAVLVDERHKFVAAMNQVTHDLRGEEWTDALLREINDRRVKVIEPELAELRLRLERSLLNAVGSKINQPVQGALGGMTLGISLALPIGSTVALAGLGALIGTGTATFEELSNRRTTLTENRLGYLLKLSEKL